MAAAIHDARDSRASPPTVELALNRTRLSSPYVGPSSFRDRADTSLPGLSIGDGWSGEKDGPLRNEERPRCGGMLVRPTWYSSRL